MKKYDNVDPSIELFKISLNKD